MEVKSNYVFHDMHNDMILILILIVVNVAIHENYFNERIIFSCSLLVHLAITLLFNIHIYSAYVDEVSLRFGIESQNYDIFYKSW
jgi:hypothetical protein